MSALNLYWFARVKIKNHNAKCLLLFYCCHNFGHNDLYFSREFLAEQLVLSPDAIKRANKFLADNDLIKIISRYGKDGGRLSNQIHLNIPIETIELFHDVKKDKLFNDESKLSTTNEVPPPGLIAPPPGANSTPNNKSFNNKSLKLSCSSHHDERQTEFEQFWEAYPRKQGKTFAKKAFSKHKVWLKLDIILEDLKNRLANDVQWSNKQFIPLPSSYLNGQKWEDEIITAPVKVANSIPLEQPRPGEPKSTVPFYERSPGPIIRSRPPVSLGDLARGLIKPPTYKKDIP